MQAKFLSLKKIFNLIYKTNFLLINWYIDYDCQILLTLYSGLFSNIHYNNISSKYKLIFVYRIYHVGYNRKLEEIHKKVLIHIILDANKTIYDLYYFQKLPYNFYGFLVGSFDHKTNTFNLNTSYNIKFDQIKFCVNNLTKSDENIRYLFSMYNFK